MLSSLLANPHRCQPASYYCLDRDDTAESGRVMSPWRNRLCPLAQAQRRYYAGLFPDVKLPFWKTARFRRKVVPILFVAPILLINMLVVMGRRWRRSTTR